jgi:hypothetical protein
MGDDEIGVNVVGGYFRDIGFCLLAGRGENEEIGVYL